MRPRILVVDHEAIICALLNVILEEDYQVICVSRSHEALGILAGQSIDIMLLDYHLPYGGAIEVVKRADEIGIPMAWMTGDPAVVEMRSHFVLLKPFHIDRVLELLTEIQSSARLVIKPSRQAGVAAS
jgi:DNA-binding NtrC family response regulator